MRAVVTVTGKDKKGIIAKVSAFLAEKGKRKKTQQKHCLCFRIRIISVRSCLHDQ